MKFISEFQKSCLVFVVSIMFIIVYNIPLNGQDLPPRSPNPVTFPTGSIVIPMNQEIQTQPSILGFNVKVYGFIYYLLDQGFKFHWAIRAGKEKDDSDFTALAKEIYPNTSGPSKNYDYVTGVFIIHTNNLEQSTECGEITDLHEAFIEILDNSEFKDVVIHELETAVTVDVAYILAYPPKIAILNDGNSGLSHSSIMQEAKIPYDLLTSVDFFNDSECYNIITQPHIEENEITNNNYYNNLKDFLNAGGNFLAQCSSIKTFEDHDHYHYDNTVDYSIFTQNTNCTYHYGEMPIMQFQGDLPEQFFGTISSYEAGTGTLLNGNAYESVKNEFDETVVSSADVNGADPGGNIFYIGGHDYDGTVTGSIAKKNQYKRLYYNSLFISSSINFACAGHDVCICEGESISIGCPELPDNVVYNWDPPTGLSCTDCAHPVASPSATTTYTQTVVGSNCTSSMVTVLVEPTNVNSATISGNETVCEYGDKAELMITFSQDGLTWGLNYSIDGVEQTIPVITSDNPYYLEVTEPGEYTITEIQVTNQEVCTKIDYDGMAYLNIADEVIVDLGADITLCEGETTLLEAASSNYQSYAWQDGSTDPTFTTSQAGTYWLEAELDGCFGRDSITVSYTPLPVVDLGEDLLFCAGEKRTITSNYGTEQMHEWSTGSNGTSIEVSEVGSYWLKVGEPGCFGTDTIEVMLEDCLPCIAVIPSAFSPNGDGINDELNVHLSATCDNISDFQFTVYNRWGQKVFDTKDRAGAWDGIFENELAPLSVYVYYASYKDEEGQLQSLKGNVTLIR